MKLLKKMKVNVRDAHDFSTGVCVIVNYDDKFQPMGEACDFLAGVCGRLPGNHILFPISFESWSSMPNTYKDNVWESALKVIDTTLNTTLNMYNIISFIHYTWTNYCIIRSLVFVLRHMKIWLKEMLYLKLENCGGSINASCGMNFMIHC